LFGLERAGLAAVDPGLALGVEAPPTETTAHVTRVDRVEPAVRIDVLDAGAHVERVVVLLGLLVRVEGFAIAEGPLALALLAARAGRCGRGGRHQVLSGRLGARASSPRRG